MKLAYVGGRYRGRTHNAIAENIHAARAVAVRLWEMDYAVICPHTNSAFMSGATKEEAFLEGGLEMLRRCDLLVLTEGWEASEGTAIEIDEAKRIGIPVFSDIEFVPPAEVKQGECVNG